MSNGIVNRVFLLVHILGPLFEVARIPVGVHDGVDDILGIVLEGVNSPVQHVHVTQLSTPSLPLPLSENQGTKEVPSPLLGPG